MFAKYRKVNPRIWNDETFQQLSPTDKLVALYLLTTDQCNRIGLYKLSIGLCAEDTGLPPETCRDNIRRVCQAFGWKFDETARVIYMPTWWKYNGTEVPDHNLLSWFDDLSTLPETTLVEEFLDNGYWLEETPRSIIDRADEIHDRLAKRGRKGALKRWQGKAIDEDKASRIFALHEQGKTQSEIAEIVGTSQPTVSRIITHGGDVEYSCPPAKSIHAIHSTQEQEQEQEQENKGVNKGGKPPKSSFDATGVELPFTSNAFREVWGDWVQHRREIKKPLTKTSVKQQTKKLADMGEKRATEAIEHTIANGWVGIREPDGTAHTNGAPKKSRPAPRRAS